MTRTVLKLIVLTLFTGVVIPQPADAQIPRRLRRAAENAASRELERKVTTVVGDAVACAVGNTECVEEAQKNGDKVVIVDEDGDVITDENGNPITDPEVAEAAGEAPGEGRWANYDYLRGERPIYNSRWNIEDTDHLPALKPNPSVRVGRIPSNLEFVSGNMQIVQLDGLNTVEFTSKTVFRVALDKPLPEDFSLEFTVQTGAPNAFVKVYFEPFSGTDKRYQTYESHYLSIWRGSGIYSQANRVSGVDQLWSLNQQLTPIKFQVDDGYGILYVGGVRVAQVPNLKHAVGSTAIEFEVNANQNLTAYLRDIRVDYGVDDPYETFIAEKEYTTRSIFFDFDSGTLRPESTPELERIRMMLDTHPDVEKVVIEGHTDAVGSDDYNLELSAARAGAVKDYLVDHGIDAGRIDTVGKGEAEPVADNDTDEGRQANRRVKVVIPEGL